MVERWWNTTNTDKGDDAGRLPDESRISISNFIQWADSPSTSVACKEECEFSPFPFFPFRNSAFGWCVFLFFLFAFLYVSSSLLVLLGLICFDFIRDADYLYDYT